MKIQQLREAVAKAVWGLGVSVEELLVAFLAGGHALLEGVPGVGKTLLARSFARAVGLSFRRIQCTPDMMPADVVGTHVLDGHRTDFVFRKGPIFSEVLLVDEVNRAIPKTQSAFLEAMEERRVTAEGTTFDLPAPFFLLATQNPIEFEGTFPLPEAQRDRFLLRIRIGYPDPESEAALVRRYAGEGPADGAQDVPTVLDRAGALELQRRAGAVRIEETVLAYALALIQATRNDASLALGASPRAAVALVRAAKASALLAEAEYVTPDEIKAVAPAVLAHRLIPKPETEIEGLDAEAVVRRLLETVPVPR